MKGLNLFLAVCFTVPTLDGAMADTVKQSTRIASGTRVPQTSTTTRNTNSARQRNNITQRTTNNKNVVSRTTTTPSSEKNRNTSLSRVATKQAIVSRTPNQNSKSRVYSRSATVQTRESVMQRDFSKCKSVFFDCMDEFCANKDTQLKRCACSARSTEFRATQKSLDNVENKLLDFSQRLLKVNMDPADAAVINQETEGERAYNTTKDTTSSRKTLDEIAKKLNSNFNSTTTVGNMSALSWSLDPDSAFDTVDSLGGTSTTAKSGVALRNAALPICREMAAEVCSADDMSLVENSYNMIIEQDCNTVKKSYDAQVQAARTKVLESGALLDMTRLNNHQDNNSDNILTCKSKMLNRLTHTNVCGDNLIKCIDISGRYVNPTTGEAFLSPDLVNLSTLIIRPSGNDTWANTPRNSSFVSYLNTKKKYIESATKNCQDIANDVWNAFIDDALAQIKLAQDAKLEEVRQSCTTLLSNCLDNARENLSDFDSRALSTFSVMADKTANALCDNVKTSCTAIMEYTPDNSAITTDTNWRDGVTEIAATETYNRIINTCREIGRDCIISSCKSIMGNFGLCEDIHSSVNRHSILTHAACWPQVYNCVAQATDASLTQIHNILPNYGTPPQALYEHMYSFESYEQAYIDDPQNNVSSIDDIDATELANLHNVYDICRDPNVSAPDSTMAAPCGTAGTNAPDAQTPECYRCRIAEQIWGNCKSKPDNRNQNRILIPDDPNTSTLLSWFAKNTHTQDNEDSCAVSICPAGSIDYIIGTSVICVAPEHLMQCQSGNLLCTTTINTPVNSTQNCCPTNTTDTWGNCCMNSGVTNTINDLLNTLTGTLAVCTDNIGTTSMTLVASYTNNNQHRYIFCNNGTVTVGGTNGNNNNGTQTTPQINCPGNYIIVDCDSNNVCRYNIPSPDPANPNAIIYDYSINYFINENADPDNPTNYCDNVANNANCTMNSNGNGWTPTDTTITCPTSITNNWLIDFYHNQNTQNNNP